MNSPPSTATQVALSACLLPVTTYAAGNDSTPPVPPAGAAGSPSQLPSGVWPADSDVLPVRADAERFPPSNVLGANAPSDRPCGGAGDPLLGLAPLSSDGSHVNVGGEITVNPVSLDVLIGDV